MIIVSAKNQEAAIDELSLALGLLVRRIRSAAPVGLQELSWTQKAVMVRLEKDGPATTAELARAEGVKPQSMGTATATLEGGLLLAQVQRSTKPFEAAINTLLALIIGR